MDNTKGDIKVSDIEITDREEFLELLNFLNSIPNQLSLNYETNKIDPFDLKHDITAIGLSYAVDCSSTMSFYYFPHKDYKSDSEFTTAFGDFLERNSERVWTYDCSFGIKVTEYLTGKFVKLQDVLVLTTMQGKRDTFENCIRDQLGKEIVPNELLGKNCAYNSGYIAILALRLKDIPEIKDSYPIHIVHPYLSAKMEINGMTWDDKKATEIYNDVNLRMIELLNSLIQALNIPEEDKLKANDIYHRNLPYDVIKHTLKTRKERKKTIKTPRDKLTELKEIFNPLSNTDINRSLFWESYLTEDIKLATTLALFIENLELTSNSIDDLYEIWGEDFFYKNPPSDSLEKLSKFEPNDYQLNQKIKKSLSFAIKEYNKNINKFSSDIVKFQYEIHGMFLKVDINDETTWSREFKMLFNLFLYKKLDKMLSSNIEGITGRKNAHYINRVGYSSPTREAPYDCDNNNETKQIVVNTNFNSLSAKTTRWTSPFHTLPPGSPARLCIPTHNDKQVCVHADYSQAELVILAYLSGDEKMLKAFFNKKDMHKFAASKMYNMEYENVTESIRKASKGVSFGIIYGKSIRNLAVELTKGDIGKAKEMFDIYYKSFPRIKKYMESKVEELKRCGHITSAFGNILKIDLMQKDKGASNRQAVNYPIQGASSVVSGTSIWDFTEGCEINNIPNYVYGFTHDAMDSITDIETIFKYIDYMVFKLETQLYERSSIPMTIDYEIGVNAFSLCKISMVIRSETSRELKISGEVSAVDELYKRMDSALNYNISSCKEINQISKYVSWAEMFTVGTAYQQNWGNTIKEKTILLKVDNIINN